MTKNEQVEKYIQDIYNNIDLIGKPKNIRYVVRDTDGNIVYTIKMEVE